MFSFLTFKENRNSKDTYTQNQNETFETFWTHNKEKFDTHRTY